MAHQNNPTSTWIKGEMVYYLPNDGPHSSRNAKSNPNSPLNSQCIKTEIEDGIVELQSQSVPLSGDPTKATKRNLDCRRFVKTEDGDEAGDAECDCLECLGTRC